MPLKNIRTLHWYISYLYRKWHHANDSLEFTPLYHALKIDLASDGQACLPMDDNYTVKVGGWKVNRVWWMVTKAWLVSMYHFCQGVMIAEAKWRGDPVYHMYSIKWLSCNTWRFPETFRIYFKIRFVYWLTFTDVCSHGFIMQVLINYLT